MVTKQNNRKNAFTNMVADQDSHFFSFLFLLKHIEKHDAQTLFNPLAAEPGFFLRTTYIGQLNLIKLRFFFFGFLIEKIKIFYY